MIFATVFAFAYLSGASAYWLMGSDFLTSQRLDPIVTPNRVSGHVHAVLGGSNFGFNVTSEKLRQSECTTMPVKEDFSNYWFPKMFFHHNDGSFSSVGGGSVVYYLFPDDGQATEFPEDFRMIAGNPGARTYDGSKAAQAVSFLCLNFNGGTTEHSELPVGKSCPSGIRAQINFPSCWDGQNIDSPDHTSHVAYLSDGPDRGECNDPRYPVRLPRIFLEVYWGAEFDDRRGEAMNPDQPYVLAHGDPTGHGHHADFYNGWERGVLDRAIKGCNCNPFGDPTCCAEKGIFTFHSNQETHCRITNSVDEQVFGNMPALPGYNPVQYGPERAAIYMSNEVKNILQPVYVYDETPSQIGTPIDDPSPFFSDNGGTLPDEGDPPTPSAPTVTDDQEPIPTPTDTDDGSDNDSEDSSENGSEDPSPPQDEPAIPSPTNVNNGADNGTEDDSDDTSEDPSPPQDDPPSSTPATGEQESNNDAAEPPVEEHSPTAQTPSPTPIEGDQGSHNDGPGASPYPISQPTQPDDTQICQPRRGQRKPWKHHGKHRGHQYRGSFTRLNTYKRALNAVQKRRMSFD